MLLTKQDGWMPVFKVHEDNRLSPKDIISQQEKQTQDTVKHAMKSE